jgi:hypothetical protein
VQWGARKLKKSNHNSKRERGGGRRTKKNTKNTPKRQKAKKPNFFSHLVALCLDPPAFPKGPWGCPLDQRSVQIQAFHRAPDLLPIHIGSWSKVKCANMTKKRVLQRVLRYYGGSTLPGCATSVITPKKHIGTCVIDCREMARERFNAKHFYSHQQALFSRDTTEENMNPQ